jgi:SAM-dependent methyltransferase
MLRRVKKVKNMADLLKSCLCTQAQLESATFRYWAKEMGVESPYLHRKLWEHCYIAQALFERGMLRPGRRGLGFAVGQEPLAPLFARYGCEIVATDLDPEAALAGGGNWVQTGQHAASLDALNAGLLCEPKLFRQRVTFRHVDMRRVPPDLRGFDFLWSSCSFEHLGSLALGQEFVSNSARCLKAGGVAVHTTEFNVSSDAETVDHSWAVIYRRRDLEQMAKELRAGGCRMAELDLHPGDSEADRFVDEPPYRHNPHLKLRIEGYVATSVGLIFEKRPRLVPFLGQVTGLYRRLLLTNSRPHEGAANTAPAA